MALLKALSIGVLGTLALVFGIYAIIWLIPILAVLGLFGGITLIMYWIFKDLQKEDSS